jgi:LysM repeat protein
MPSGVPSQWGAGEISVGRNTTYKGMRTLFLFVLLGAVLVAGCSSGPAKQPVPEPPGPSSPSGPGPGQPPSPPPPTTVTPPAPPTASPSRAVEPSLADKKQAQRLALDAAILLDEGKEAEAKAKLTDALKLDSRNDLANLLMSTITDDPMKLGAKSFPYKVQSGDKLSKISELYLKDQYKFYLLARYNNIAVPRSLKAGQVIRVPGTAPVLPVAISATTPTPVHPPPKSTVPASPQAEHSCQEGLQLLSAADKDRAYDAFLQCWKSDPGNQQARAQVESLRPELVRTHDRAAREAFRKQDLDACIKEWDRVLQLDPGNETARLERQRSIELKKHFEEVK